MQIGALVMTAHAHAVVVGAVGGFPPPREVTKELLLPRKMKNGGKEKTFSLLQPFCSLLPAPSADEKLFILQGLKQVTVGV
jgi:hypothetical protein